MFRNLFTCSSIAASRALFAKRAFEPLVITSRHSPAPRSHLSTMAYSIIERGKPNTLDYRMFINGPTGVVSPLHDIPLYADEENNIFNMVVEIPRWSNAKMEISKDQKMNPIIQDTKNGKLRYVHNVFPHHGYIWNYGALPQTYEDPDHIDEYTKQRGDDDPVDVCEIGRTVHKRGAVIQVKILGVFALIDEGETDWKILCIDITDPMAASLNDLCDVKKHMPGFLQATHSWFKNYKIPAGKPVNKFAFNGQPKNAKFALKVIKQTNDQWRQLIKSSESADGSTNIKNTTNGGTSGYITASEATEIVESCAKCDSPAPIPVEVDAVSFLPKMDGNGDNDDDHFDENNFVDNDLD